MPRATQEEVLKQVTALDKTKAEMMAVQMLALLGNPETQSQSAVLSLMLLAAEDQSQSELMGMLIGLDGTQGPQKALIAALGTDDPHETMQDLGPMEAGEQLNLQATAILLA